MLIDNFNQQNDSNTLGGHWSTYQGPVGGSAQLELAEEDCESRSSCLALSYSLPPADSFAGVITSLDASDLRGYHSLRMRVKANRDGEDLVVGLKDSWGRETKLQASHFLGGLLPSEWTTLEIPLTAFTDVIRWSSVDNRQSTDRG